MHHFEGRINWLNKRYEELKTESDQLSNFLATGHITPKDQLVALDSVSYILFVQRPTMKIIFAETKLEIWIAKMLCALPYRFKIARNNFKIALNNRKIRKLREEIRRLG